jgi:SYP7 family syntaxin
MGDQMDAEVTDMIDKLTAMQAKLGGKQSKAIVGDDGKIDKFSEIKVDMSERLLVIRQLLDKSQQSGHRTEGGAKEAIECQAQIRRELATIQEEWEDLNRIFQVEAKKRRSKYSPEDLARRRMVVGEMQNEIKTIKDIQRSGFVMNYQAATMATMKESELFRESNLEAGAGAGVALGGGGSGGGGGGGGGGGRGLGVSGTRNNDMTGEQKMQLQALKEKDREIDREIELVGEGVDQLKVLAQAQNQEVKLQNRMLGTLEEKMEEVGR